MRRLPTSIRSLIGASDAAPTPAQVVQAIIFAVGLGLTGLQWSTIYANYGALPPIAISGVVSITLGLLIAARLPSAAQSAPIAIVTLLLGSAAWYGSNSNSLIEDLATSWKLLASTGLLAPTTQKFLLVPVVITFLAGWIAAEIIARRKPALSLMVPMALAHGVTLAYSVSQRQPTLFEAGFLGVALLAIAGIATADRHPGLVASPNPEESASRLNSIGRRRLLTAVPLALSIGAAGVGAALLLGTGSNNPFDLRERLVRPLEVYETTSPLSQVKAGLIADEPTEIFAISVDGLSSDETIDRIIVATLDVYDGALWSSSARFESAGAVLPAPSQRQSLDSRSLIQAVKIEAGYPFHFLPRVGQITQTDSLFLGWDPRSGSLANVDPDRQEYSYGTRVRRSATLTQPDQVLSELASLRSVELSDPNDELRYATSLPELSEQQMLTLDQIISSAADSDVSEIEILENIVEHFRSESFAFNAYAPSGHSIAALISYLDAANGLTDDGSQAVSVGSTEHSAAAFALLARYMGIPSRVVVGYELASPLVWDEQRQVVTQDLIHAWPEIWIDGYGWMGFEPTNKTRTTDEVSERSPVVGDTGSESANTAQLPDLQAPVLIPDVEKPNATNRRLVAATVALAVPLLILLGAIGAKRLRRAARKRGSASDRISGAWLETREALEAFELPSSKASTVLEIAEELNQGGHMTVAVPVAKMANTVTKALYAPEEPTQDEADAIWEQANIAISQVKAAASRGQRLRAAADPRVLIRN